MKNLNNQNELKLLLAYFRAVFALWLVGSKKKI